MHKIKLSAGEADEFYNLEHIPIAQDAIHPSYNGNTNSNDFWAIKLQWASKLYADQVVALDSPTDGLELKSGDELVTFGFGTLTSGGITPNILQEVTIDYIPNANCGSYPSSQIDASVSCASYCVFINPHVCLLILMWVNLTLEWFPPTRSQYQMICAGRPGKDSCQVTTPRLSFALHLIIRLIHQFFYQLSRVTRVGLFFTLLRISLLVSFLGVMDVRTLIILEVSLEFCDIHRFAFASLS